MPAAANACSPRDRLLDAATELFATRGYQAIGLRDLASHLGLRAGSLYHHIENKQCLLFELIESTLADLVFDTKRCMKGARTPEERLQRFVQAFVRFNLAHAHRVQLVTREYVNLSHEQQLQIDALNRSHASILSGIIASECARDGRQGGAIGLVTHAVIGMLYGHAQWRGVQVSEQGLTQALITFVTGIIESAKNNSNMA
ncbi:TetR/AcrR family transcriptional regulator [Pseudomonas qingdaonensis]|uniref:TetR/AcrR family transcriptional regulator n=1 Tax=Pseudomonas qingdaonensis TaxID=2056231 RepID=A0ABX8DYA7_9PSED|nr:TetR/AcrR family transcriptional regulator [Pseudomonas qingdaonensis]QVL21117.1 TetR/AcrR family transcriptional regulator [Pseudomonas qingdaonensis]